MHSVDSWAKQQGWDYQCLDDQFFDLAPQWVSQRCDANIYALTDVCRLQLLRNHLDSGYERVIWADADILMFAPERVAIESVTDHAFAYELIPTVNHQGDIASTEGINNSLMIFDRNQTVLDQYLDTCFATLRELPAGPVPRTALGPDLLRGLNTVEPLNSLNSVGLFTEHIIHEVVDRTDAGPFTRVLLESSVESPGAANLCHFLRNLTPAGDRAEFDTLYQRAVMRILHSGRDTFNRDSINLPAHREAG